MATDSATSQSGTVHNMACGSFTGDGTITTVTCGFIPRRIELINATDRIKQVWQEGLAATQTINTDAAGASTLNTGTLVAPSTSADTFQGFRIAAAAAVSAKAYVWTAWG